MNVLELLNQSEMKLDEAVRHGSQAERDYWRGYADAVNEFVSIEAEVRSNYVYPSIILAMADCNMNVNSVARNLHYSRNTISYHIDQITRQFGLDPRKFYDLCQLVKMMKGGDLV